MNEQAAPMACETPTPRETVERGLGVLATCHSVCGVRDVNQDVAALFCFKAQDARVITIAAVADGMGGLEGGEVAAAEAVTAFSLYAVSSVLLRAQTQEEWDTAGFMEKAFCFANSRVMAENLKRSGLGGMGTTLTAAVVVGNSLFVASVGDSRCYLGHGDTLNQLSRDDSFVQPLVEQGFLSREEAENHPRANEITRALGWPEDVKEVSATRHALTNGDLVILCSDGLWKGGHPSLCTACVDLAHQPFVQASLDQVAATLIDGALERGADDNVSVALLWAGPGATPDSDEAVTNNTEEI